MLALLLLSGCGRKATVHHLSVVPEPVFLVEKESFFTLPSNPKVSMVNLGQNSATVKYIMRSLRHSHMHPRLVAVSRESDIELQLYDTLNSELGDEGYLLEVRGNGIRLSANTEIGLFYAYQTLLQFLPVDVTRVPYSSIALPECTILDYPRFPWRGVHVNLSGHPMSVKSIRKLTDVMAHYKMNRLCIDGGVWNEDTSCWMIDSSFSYRREEVEELLSYAAMMGVTLVWDSLPMACASLHEGLDSARVGWEVVMSPSEYWDFDRYQADSRYQPQASEGVVTLGRAYEFDPVPLGTNTHLASMIAGGQCRLLTDCVDSDPQVEYMLLPRMLAVSECLWSPRDQKDWNRFRRKTEVQKDRLESMGFRYCEGSFTPLFSARRVDDHTMNITISTEVPNTYIFYTTDLSTPTRQSNIYLGPVNLSRGTHIKLLPVYKGEVRDSVYEFVIK